MSDIVNPQAVGATTAVQVILPDSITTRQDPGPVNQALMEKAQHEIQLVSGLMLIDKVAKEDLIKEQTPIHDKALRQAALLEKRIVTKAKKIIAAMKQDAGLHAVRDAMDAIGIAVNCNFEFIGIDVSERTSDAIKYKCTVENKASKRSYGNADSWSSDAIELPFTDDLKDLQAAYWKQRDIVSATRKIICDASAMLNNRANRMADAHSLVALSNMSADDKAKIKALQGRLNDMNISKLLAEGK